MYMYLHLHSITLQIHIQIDINLYIYVYDKCLHFKENLPKSYQIYIRFLLCMAISFMWGLIRYILKYMAGN